MIEWLFYLILLFIGIPTGILLVKLCRDEIKNWRGRLVLIIGISIVLSLILAFSGFVYKVPSIVGLLFIVVVNLVIIRRSW